MQTAASSSFLIDTSSLKRLTGIQTTSTYGDLYQQLFSGLRKGIYTKYSLLEFAKHIVRIADCAYTVRQTEVIEQAGDVLLHLPIPCLYRKVGEYYKGIAMRQQGNVAQARTMLERVAEYAPLAYRARAVQYLGSIAHTTGDYQSALPLYVEASRIAASGNWCDPHTTATAQQNVAILKSIDGDHRGALADLENLYPLVRALGTAEPYKQYHYLNSLSVELSVAGRYEEAGNICRIVLASPYAFAYLEWRETEQDLALRGYKSRSSVRVTQVIPRNLFYMPEPSPATGPPVKSGRARVLSIKKWKKKMGKENGEQNLDEMSDKDLFMEIMHQTSQGTITRKKLLKIISAIQRIKSEPDED
jgi:tetratricopeptide (TPR) repeat protein